MTTGNRGISRWSKVMVCLGLIVVVLSMAAPASAHDNSSESITLEVNEQRIVGTARVAFAGLGYHDTNGDGLQSPREIDELATSGRDAGVTPFHPEV